MVKITQRCLGCVLEMALPEPQEQLCFSPEELLNSDFQVDDFVSRCRKRATMEGLREELHSYFKTLKSAMVELINKDYADFVNLSANLVNHLHVQLLLFIALDFKYINTRYTL